jgi:flagellar basal-body rod protein FlgC
MKAMEISRTGLDVEWRRLEVIADNIANAGSAGVAGAQAYQPLRLITGPKGDFASHLGTGDPGKLDGVAVYGVAPQDVAPRRVHEPGNPAADKDGYVTYPGLDQATEMTLMVKTARAYEANMVAMNAARQMYVKALDLGRKS